MKNLDEILKIYGITQTELAYQMGYTSRKIVNEWISGRKDISPKRLPQLLAILQIPQHFLNKNLTEDDKIEMYRVRLSKEFNKEFNIISK